MSFLRRIFSSKVLPSWAILIFDIGITLVAVLTAFLLRYSPADMNARGVELLMTLGITLAFNLVFFRVFHTYSNVLRFSSFTDILHISAALIGSFVATVLVSFISEFGFKLPLTSAAIRLISLAESAPFSQRISITLASLSKSFSCI